MRLVPWLGASWPRPNSQEEEEDDEDLVILSGWAGEGNVRKGEEGAVVVEVLMGAGSTEPPSQLFLLELPAGSRPLGMCVSATFSPRIPLLVPSLASLLRAGDPA